MLCMLSVQPLGNTCDIEISVRDDDGKRDGVGDGVSESRWMPWGQCRGDDVRWGGFPPSTFLDASRHLTCIVRQQRKDALQGGNTKHYDLYE